MGDWADWSIGFIARTRFLGSVFNNYRSLKLRSRQFQQLKSVASRPPHSSSSSDELANPLPLFQDSQKAVMLTPKGLKVSSGNNLKAMLQNGLRQAKIAVESTRPEWVKKLDLEELKKAEGANGGGKK